MSRRDHTCHICKLKFFFLLYFQMFRPQFYLPGASITVELCWFTSCWLHKSRAAMEKRTDGILPCACL